MKRAILIVVLAGCTGSANYWVAYRPIHGAKTTTVQKAVIAVGDAGREVESNEAGVVTTKGFRADAFPRDSEFRIRIVVSESGGYDISAMCKRDGDGDCGDDKRPRFVLDTMAKIEAGL